MAGYPGLPKVTNTDVRACLKTLFDLVNAQAARIQALETDTLKRGSAIDAGGQRVSNVGQGTQAGDAVTLDQVRRLVDTVKKATY